MKRIVVLMILIFSTILTTQAQIPTYQWAKGIGGTGFDRSNRIATDASGNVYITGSFSATADFDPGPGVANLTAGGSNDIFFAKYDANGNYIWAKKIGSTSPGSEAGYGIAVDAGGNVYLTGQFIATADFDPGPGTVNLTSFGSIDVFLAKYNSSGNYIWAKKIGGASNDDVKNIWMDAGGNLFIIGTFLGTADFDPGAGVVNLTSSGNNDICFAKYDANGNYVWAKSIGGANNDSGWKIVVHATGNVYICGSFSGTSDFDPGPGTVNLTSAGVDDLFFAKYDGGGNYIWAKRIGSTADDNAYSIATDAAENVYITGSFQLTVDFDPGPGTFNMTSNGIKDILFAKYDSSGNYIWAKNIGSSGNYGYGWNIALDAGINIYLTGWFRGTTDFDSGPGTVNLTSSAGSFDILFAKYDNNGNYIWAKNIGSANDDFGWDIISDVGSNVYITGQFDLTPDFDPGPGTANLTSAGNGDIFFAKYSQCTIPSTPGAISGNTTVCTGSNPSYSVTNDPTATSYSWSLPGSWTGTSTTNIISPIPGTSGIFSVTATNTCGTSSAQTLSVTVNTCTGLSSLSPINDELKLYPNPTSCKIMISGIFSQEKIEVYNILGELIYGGKIENENFEIDLSKENSGIYLIRIGTEIKRIVKE